MYEVAEFLKDVVVSGGAVPYQDQYARTTFNRYYYAVYHKINGLVVRIHPNKAGMSHKAIPDYLRGEFRKSITNQLKRGWKTLSL